MSTAFIISVILVTSIVSFLIIIERRKKGVLSIEIFPFKFKYVGGTLVIISIFLSFIEPMDEDLFNNIRVLIANLGLIVITLSKDKPGVNDRNFIKMACFSLSTFISYLVNHVMVIFFGAVGTIELSRFILDLLVIYLISYHFFINYKLAKSG